MKRESPSVTIKTLAEKAGVSYATVSLALNGDPRVAERTRRKISALAGRYNYVPNNFGRALQSSRSRLAGYMIRRITTSFFSEILQGLGECASGNGYGLLVAVTESCRSEAEQLRLFREKRMDGLIVSNVHSETKELLSELSASGFPVVVCSGISFDERIPYVVTDDFTGGAIAAAHLIELGHRRMVYYGGLPDRCRRYRGICSEARKNGLGKVAACGNETELYAALKPGKTIPTAVIAYSDVLAIEAKHVIESRGLRIPDDVSLIGYDNLWTDSLPEFNLTSVAPQKGEIGRLSMEMLMDLIAGRKVRPVLVKPEIYIRKSTAPQK